MRANLIEQDTRRGIVIEVEDRNDRIPALGSPDGTPKRAPFSGLSADLLEPRRFMDELSITVGLGQGTQLRMVKWLPSSTASP